MGWATGRMATVSEGVFSLMIFLTVFSSMDILFDLIVKDGQTQIIMFVSIGFTDYGSSCQRFQARDFGQYGEGFGRKPKSTGKTGCSA